MLGGFRLLTTWFELSCACVVITYHYDYSIGHSSQRAVGAVELLITATTTTTNGSREFHFKKIFNIHLSSLFSRRHPQHQRPILSPLMEMKCAARFTPFVSVNLLSLARITISAESERKIVTSSMITSHKKCIGSSTSSHLMNDGGSTQLVSKIAHYYYYMRSCVIKVSLSTRLSITIATTNNLLCNW